MSDFDPDDIAAVRSEGDLGRLLRDEIAKGRARRTQPATKPPPPAPPGRRPGAWPVGTRPPDPPSPVPDATVHAALADYRQWLADGSPPGPHHCECTACRHSQGSTE